MLKTRSSDKLHLVIDDKPVEQVKPIRYLGIEIDENLKWNSHIAQLSKSLSYKIFSLGKLRHILNKTLLNILYKSIIQPCFDYAISVWGNKIGSNALSKLFRLQKRAARYVTGNFDYVNYSGEQIVKEIKWTSIEQRRDYFLANLMYKCIHGLAPSRLCNNIEMVCERHDVRTRNYNTLNVVPPKPNIECFKKCFMYSAAQVWNKLPDSLKNAVSVNSFKLSYKKMYF